MFKRAIKEKRNVFAGCILALLMSFVFVVTMFSSKAADVAITDGDLSSGRSFEGGENLQISKDLTAAPKTYEAVVYVPETVTAEGTIFGNYINLTAPHINFAINSSGQPKIYIHDSYVKSENQTTLSFGSSIKGEKWVHVVITHESDEAGDVFKCYVDGVLTGEKTSSNHHELNMDDIQSMATFYLGQDFRTPYNDETSYHFKGKIKNLALYSEVLTADEIASSYASGVDTSNESLMLYYDLTSAEGLSNVSDLSGNGYNVEPLYHNRDEEISKTDYPYSFAIVGDTQFILDNDVNNMSDDDAENDTDYFADIYNWIIENREAKNIQRVLGLGDITESNTAAEWEYAVSQFEKLEEEGIPYSITWGYSHDGLAGEEFTSYFKDLSNFTESDITYCSGVDSATSLANYCQRFTVGETKYMVMSLGWAPKLTSEVLAWADEQIKEYDDHKVIIITHYYLGLDGENTDETEAIWDEVITDNPNVAMILSGHIHYSANIIRSFRVGRAGHTVAQFLINPQYMDKYYGYDKTGMVAMFYFSEDGSDFKVEYVSTTKTMAAQETDSSAEDVLYGSKNEFTFNFPAKLQTEYGEIEEGYESVTDYPFVIFDNNGNWVGASDCLLGENSASSAIALAKDYLKQNAWDGESYGESEISVTILMRDDVEMGAGEYYNNFSQIQGTVNIDLNGYTLSAPSDKALFNVTLKAWSTSGDETVFPSEITVTNGDINIYGRELVRFASDNKDDTAGKKFTVNFNSVDVFVKGAASSLVLKSDVTTSVTEQDTYINFNDCNIDFTDATSTVTVCAFANQAIDAEVTFNGGSIISDESNYVFVETVTSYGGLSFDGDGEYTVLKLPEGVEATSEKFNGGILSYEESSVDESGIVTYELLGYIEGYGSFPAKYHSAEKYPFVIFNNSNEFVNASSYLYGAKASDSAMNLAKEYLKANKWDGTSYGNSAVSAYIVMRCDVEMASTEQFNNISQIQGVLTIDLNNYTLSAPNASDKYLFPSELKAWTGSGDKSLFPSEINVINGSINTYYKPLIQFKPNSNSVADGYAKKLDYKFSNVKFFVKGSTSEFAINHATSGTAELYPSVTFTDCTIDLTEATADTITLFSLGNTNTNAIVTVNGGSIILGEKNTVMQSQVSGNGSLTFGMGSDNAYTTITVPNGVELPVKSVNNGDLYLVKIKEDTVETVYQLAAADFVDYIPQMSITLANSFIMNVYVPVNCTEEFTFGGVTYNADNSFGGKVVTLDGEDYYLVTVALGSSEAAKDMKLVAKVTVGENTAAATFTFSIPKYAQKLLNDDGATEVEKQLVKDVLAYIQSAYNYFAGHNTTEEIARVNALVNELLSVGGEYSGDPDLDGTYSHNTALVKDVTLVLDAKPTIRFYVTDLNVEFYDAEGNMLNTVKNEDEKYVELDVYAYALSGEITYKLGEESGTYHISHYVKMTEADTDPENYDNLVNLVCCFVKYTESAADYRESVIGAEN